MQSHIRGQWRNVGDAVVAETENSQFDELRQRGNILDTIIAQVQFAQPQHFSQWRNIGDGIIAQSENFQLFKGSERREVGNAVTAQVQVPQLDKRGQWREVGDAVVAQIEVLQVGGEFQPGQALDLPPHEVQCCQLFQIGGY